MKIETEPEPEMEGRGSAKSRTDKLVEQTN